MSLESLGNASLYRGSQVGVPKFPKGTKKKLSCSLDAPYLALEIVAKCKNRGSKTQPGVSLPIFAGTG